MKQGKKLIKYVWKEILRFGEAKKKSKQKTLNEFYGKPNDDETD